VAFAADGFRCKMEGMPHHQSLSELTAQALAWAEDDPDESTARELRRLVECGDEGGLLDAMVPPLSFGTAGLRGIVGAGPARMNTAGTRRVTLALAQYVMATCAEPGAPRMVVGFDARLDSQRFAEEAIRVLRAVGIEVSFFDEPVPTPEVVFAGHRLRADATIVVTASHNPAEYNGYKVYGRNGVQIVPPMDTQVMRLLAAVGPAKAIGVDGAPAQRLGDSFHSDYAAQVQRGRVAPPVAPGIRVAYSPLHGVGGRMARRVFAEAGYRDFVVEPSQFAPDGHFPTAAFPNPEEPEAMKRGLLLAEACRADLLVVNDPDADRLRVALPDEQGKLRALSGNQIGVVLCSYILSKWPDPTLVPVVVSTLVSTPMTQLVAREHGAHFEATLTGFKWLWTAALELLGDPKKRFAIAFEEALGYSTHPAVRDKDGIAAGVLFADWVSSTLAEGILPWRALGELYRRHGAWASLPHNVVRGGARGLEEIAAAVRRIAEVAPTALGGCPVTRVVDYRISDDSRPWWRSVADMVEIWMGDEARIVARPSGTEPKLKFYADVREGVGPSEDPFVAYGRAEARAQRIIEDLLSHAGLAEP
jgi:phosphomannomutase